MVTTALSGHRRTPDAAAPLITSHGPHFGYARGGTRGAARPLRRAPRPLRRAPRFTVARLCAARELRAQVAPLLPLVVEIQSSPIRLKELDLSGNKIADEGLVELTKIFSVSSWHNHGPLIKGPSLSWMGSDGLWTLIGLDWP